MIYAYMSKLLIICKKNYILSAVILLNSDSTFILLFKLHKRKPTKPLRQEFARMKETSSTQNCTNFRYQVLEYSTNSDELFIDLIRLIHFKFCLHQEISLRIIAHSFNQAFRKSIILENCLLVIFICILGNSTKSQSTAWTVKRVLKKFKFCNGQIVSAGFCTVHCHNKITKSAVLNLIVSS